MKFKRISRISCGFILIAVIALLIFVISRWKQEEISNPNLMTAQKVFLYQENADARLKRILEDKELKKIFKIETINCRYPQMKWSGRIKYSNISYHALFAVDNSKIIFKLKKIRYGSLTFSIFNPDQSRLFYKIVLKHKNQEINLFKKFYDKETLVSETINLEHTFDRGVELIFETGGRGIGAWINPLLKTQKKNPKVFIVIVLDTLRYDHASLYGYSRKTTPFLDRLSQDAVVFQEAYSTTSWTLPAHVSLFTGKNLDEHGVITPNDRISNNCNLVSEIFQEKGYVTAAFTGGGFIEDIFGFYRGFQIYSNIPGEVFSKNSAERVFNHFTKYIERFWGNDLFVFLHTYQIHAPYKAPHEYIDQINKDVRTNLKGIKNFTGSNHEYFKAIDPGDRQLLIDLYDASILYTDKMLVGSMVDFLKEKGVYDDTMLVVLSDHGEEFFDHFSWEHGHTLYKELIKIPLVVKYPKNREKGKKDALVSITDIPGMILKESGLPYDETVFGNKIGHEKRVLPILLPLSPIIKQFPPKISFVDKDYHFIINIWDKKKAAFFDPQPPVAQEIELYETRDYLEMNNLYRRRKSIVNRYLKNLEKYLKQIKGIKMGKFQFGKELEEKLKSLGYLLN